MRFVTLFLKTGNVHLIKDVGMIPYHLYRDHGFDCSVACYDNGGDYSYADNEVKGLKIDLVKKTRAGIIGDGIGYLVKNARKIDILNIYHLNLSSYFYEIAYRIFNPKGKIYLKLDMNPAGFISCFKKNPVGIIKRATIRRADLVSVETTMMLKKLKIFYGDKVIYIPNGCYREEAEDEPAAKEDVILTVGNLGTREKATDVLLEAYASYIKASPYSKWKLRLVGSIADEFGKYMDEYFKRYPDIREMVTFTGPISDKRKLDEEYRKAKVFTLPSL
ncbi:MAG: glycosyltransferase, partial [Lachnospiraceae bacterium]|nr:glycosyltransferase [Lachnospiraceae bacterium]